jgi:hypothetical protein
VAVLERSTGSAVGSSRGLWLGVVVAMAFGGFVLVTAKSDVTGTRLDSGLPAATPPAPLWGFAHWPVVFTWVVVVGSVAMVAGLVRQARAQRRFTSELVAYVALVGVSWVDPLGNWSVHAVMDPRLLHVPADWPWVDISPGITMVVVPPAYPLMFLSFALLIRGVHRRWIRPRTPGLVGVTLTAIVLGATVDVLAQLAMMHTDIYVYTQWAGPALESNGRGIPLLPVVYDTAGITMTTLIIGGFVASDRLRRPARISVAWVALSAMLLVPVAVGGILRAADGDRHTFHGPWPYAQMTDVRPGS